MDDWTRQDYRTRPVWRIKNHAGRVVHTLGHLGDAVEEAHDWARSIAHPVALQFSLTDERRWLDAATVFPDGTVTEAGGELRRLRAVPGSNWLKTESGELVSAISTVDSSDPWPQ